MAVAVDNSTGAGNAVGDGSSAFANLIRCGAVAVQLGIVLLLFKSFRLEGEAFDRVLLFTFVGFPIHHLLPMRFRLPFFVVLSLVSIFVVIGAANAFWVIGLGAVLIGLCHLPVPFRLRLLLVILAGAVLAVFRAGWMGAPWSNAVWPILGAMFMFRLIVYLYDVAHATVPFGPWRAFAYFFMVPNVCFPLFPVVDYQTFCRTYYNEDPFKIYQVGIRWLVRGAFHLIIYRFVYQFLVVDPAEVVGAGSLFQNMTMTYLLYLRVSGLFHTIIGLLHLFGFNLPETHHHFFLAASFTDFWRRINIYWKDFIMKILFYPLYFKLRKLGKLGNLQAMILATLMAFAGTWFLHAYQWFWIRGAFLWTPQDVLFWLILALFVTGSVWNESRSKKKVVPKTGAESAVLALVLGLKTVVTYCMITFLWSLWTADSISEWLATLTHLKSFSATDALMTGAALGALGIVAIIVGRDQWLMPSAQKVGVLKAKPFNFWRCAVIDGVFGVVLVTLSLSMVQSHLGPRVAELLKRIEKPSLNAQDAAILQRGYYEDLIQVHRFNEELEEMYRRRPSDYFVEWRQAMNHRTDDYLGVELSSSTTLTYEGATYTTNRWGMRDKDYEKEKGEGVFRIGLIGSSHTMGWGVNDEETFENLVEGRLDSEAGISTGLKYELLNFSVNGYDPIQKLIALEGKLVDFDLDVVMILCHRIEKQWLVSHMVERVRSEVEVPYPYLEEIIEKSEITPDMDMSSAKIYMSDHGTDVLRWAFDAFAKTGRAQGITSVWVYMPEAGHFSLFDRDISELFAAAEDAEFSLIQDWTDVYKGHPAKKLRLSQYDGHPSAYAHTLLAERLYETIVGSKTIFAPNSAAQ